MNPKKRIWIAVTLAVIVAFNYGMIGLPLHQRAKSVQQETKALLIKEVKSGGKFNNSADTYLLEIFRKEKASLDHKILILNGVAISALLIIISWTVFGLLFHRKK